MHHKLGLDLAALGTTLGVSMPFSEIEMQFQPDGSAMRWSVPGGVFYIWSRTKLLGTLSGESIRQAIAEKLSAAALALRVQGELGEPEAAVLPPAPAEAAPPPRKGTVSPHVKAARRHARRARTKKKLAAWLIAAWAAGSLALLGWDCRTDLLNAQPRPAHAVVQDLP